MARSSTTYDRKWMSIGKTRVIRVPERMADQLLEIAHRLDVAPDYCLKEDGNAFVLELAPVERVRYAADKPVNVGSVPQRSPFRYPGGKTWLVPYIRDWLKSKKSPPSRLIEPFAGSRPGARYSGKSGRLRHG